MTTSESLQVNVGVTPGKINAVSFPVGTTVKEAIASYDSNGYEVTVNGARVDLDHVISDRDTILLSQKIAGA